MKIKPISLLDKRGIEIPFSWLFAMVAGAVIIIIALMATSKIVNQGQQTTYSETAQQLGNLLNPVVNGLGSSAYGKKIDLLKQTRIYSYCYETSDKSPLFGRQTLAIAEESGYYKKWNNVGINVSRYNKFIFSKNIEEGKRLYIFAKPFYSGFRVDDIILLTAEKYCFAGAPADMEESISALKLGNINFTTTVDLCPRAATTTVCFGSTTSAKCNISVIGDCMDDSCEGELGAYERGYVMKNGKSMPYFGNLIYAAIASSPEIYSCNLNRLGSKISELAKVYKDKIDIVKIKGCDSLLEPYLDQLISTSSRIKTNPSSIYEIRLIGKQMDDENTRAICKLY